MTHIDEFTLNEYVDNALSDKQRADVETHLQQCADCQAELAALEQLFLTLENSVDVPLTVDVAAAVAAQIEQEKAVGSERWSVNSGLLLVLESVAAGILLFLLWPTVQEWLMLARSWQDQFAADFAALKLVSWVEITAVFATPLQAISHQLQSTSFSELATLQWGMLLGIALIIWLVGNRLLFTNDSGGSHG